MSTRAASTLLDPSQGSDAIGSDGPLARVIVVDDEEPIRSMLARLLTRPLEVTNGRSEPVDSEYGIPLIILLAICALAPIAAPDE